MSLMSLTAVTLGNMIKAKQVSVLEATQATFTAIDKREPKINSFITIDKEKAFARAKEVQKGIEDGTYTGVLAGVPIACLLYTSPSPRD